MTIDLTDPDQSIAVWRCNGCGALAVVEDADDPELDRWYRRVQ